MTLTVPHLRNSIILLITLAVFPLSFIGCGNLSGENQKDETFYAGGTKDGYVLAKQYCSTCHKFVPASFANRQSWQMRVLPQMATKLGIGVFGEKEYINNPYIPSVVSFKNWMKIVDYYTKSAPEELTFTEPPVPIIQDWSIFELKEPPESHFSFSKTVLTKIDTATDNIYIADANTNYLYRLNNKLQVTDSLLTNSPVVSASFFNDSNGTRRGIFTTIGSLAARDNLQGELLKFNIGNKSNNPVDIIAANLPRPVQSLQADFNNDGLQDYAVCGFGHNKGGLYWFQQLPGGGFRKNVILETPGAIQAIAGDFNKDGKTDLMVLFAQAEESIRLFINDGKGSFIMNKLLSFPPVYGSTSFQLADFNKDGLPDILYTCGDNADLTQEFKPYHGVYIYLNKGNFKFEQSYFYHINGCTKAVAADFDGDGDLDIATIAFFADFRNNPAEKFLYFKQNEPMHFQPYSPPIEKYGRWLCMDVADYDHDGDPDIVLGNFSAYLLIDKSFAPNWYMRLPMIVLENKTISGKQAGGVNH